jgi:hypothetical protein
MNEISYNMIKNRINFNNKKRVVVVTAGAAAATIMLVVSIATIGAAPFSYQQGASDRTGPRITSANIVDGEVKNQDLAPDAVTSDKIKDGEVKAEDLDPSLTGGTAGGFEFQVTERSNSVVLSDEFEREELTISVQCNSDEIVTGGGFGTSEPRDAAGIVISKKQDNGWSASWSGHLSVSPGRVMTVYAECLKVVNE